MKKFITSVFSLLLILTAITAHAADIRYNVEVVIFEDIDGRYINSEQWPIIHHPENELETENEKKQIKNNRKIKLTHQVSDALSEHVAKLNTSERYNVLLHQSWQQAGLSNAEAINIQVNSAEIEKKYEDNQEPKSSIEGTLKLILGRYLHIHTDLLYKRLNQNNIQTTETLNNKVFSEFKIKSQRRMRSKEVHYIDHPLVGILVLVTPIKPPETAQQSE